jgi:hypothetical protein
MYAWSLGNFVNERVNLAGYWRSRETKKDGRVAGCSQFAILLLAMGLEYLTARNVSVQHNIRTR